jgi:hypothetical protein
VDWFELKPAAKLSVPWQLDFLLVLSGQRERERFLASNAIKN